MAKPKEIPFPSITIHDGPFPWFGEHGQQITPTRIIPVNLGAPLGHMHDRGWLQLADSVDVRVHIVLDKQSIISLRDACGELIKQMDVFFDTPVYCATEDKWVMPKKNRVGGS